MLLILLMLPCYLPFTSFLFWPFPFSFSSLLLFSNGSVVCLLDADTVTYVRMQLLYYSFSWEMQRRIKEQAGKKGLDLFLCNFSCLSFILSVSLSPHIFAYKIHTTLGDMPVVMYAAILFGCWRQ